MKFENKVALVTGASSGIGKATAIAFAKQGARVVLADVATEAGRQAAAEIESSLGVPALFVPCDVSKAADVEQLVRAAVDRFGRLDFAFNNAGIEGLPTATEECTEESWNRLIDINLKGVWLCMKHELPLMVRQGEGAIVNCSSIAGVVGFPMVAAYTASKHGVIGLTKAAALEHAKRKIRVNAVCPGVIATPMVDRFTEKAAERETALVSGAPMGRIGRPEEIADAVLWLCGGESSYVTGHALIVDGGWTAQ